MQPGQPDWNVTKVGNDYEQWNVYDDNNNGQYIATVVGERNARLVAAAPDMLLLLKEIYDWTRYKDTLWSVKVQNVLNQIEG